MIIITPGKLSLATLEKIYRSDVPFSIDRSFRKKIEKAQDIVSDAALSDIAVYGVNTGFGKLAQVRIHPDEVLALQKNLILSHCCGVGAPLSDGVVRLVVALKLCSVAQGASGVGWCVIEALEALSINRITPIIPEKGSVGASGDLAPLAHLAAVMMGFGQAKVGSDVLPSEKVLAKFDLDKLVLGPKEGLALINGTQVSAALALGSLFDAWRCMQNAVISGALSVDAAMASSTPFRDEIQQLRGQKGQILVARVLRSLLHQSEISRNHREDDDRVQDPYCFRCQPQVMGACLDLMAYSADTLVREANAVTDNPLIIQETNEIISGGNFHAEPVAFAADQIALAIAEIGSIVERRIASLVDPTLSYGLPAFLSPSPGVNSGFMIAEVTAAALMSENKQKASSCSIDSIPTSANQEDHVSMSCYAARRLIEMNQNLSTIIGIEFLLAAQGVEFRSPLQTSLPLQNVVEKIRDVAPKLESDRYMSDDLVKMSHLVSSQTLSPQCVNDLRLPFFTL